MLRAKNNIGDTAASIMPTPSHGRCDIQASDVSANAMTNVSSRLPVTG